MDYGHFPALLQPGTNGKPSGGKQLEIIAINGCDISFRKHIRGMQVKDILRKLKLGNAVAEFDTSLEDYFVETETFRRLTDDEGDIIAGDKGTGKSALYQILLKRYKGIPALQSIEVISGFNPTGSPVFQRLTEGQVLTEGQYQTIWKAYILSLIGNWVLQICEGSFSERMETLDQMLTKVGLRTADGNVATVFSRIWNVLKRWAKPKSAEVKFSLTKEGLPEVTPKLEFPVDESQGGDASPTIIHHQELLNILNEVLMETGVSVWLILDRLDEAFQGSPEMETPALRALVRTYLDLLEFSQIRLKLFVRHDLFRKITDGGFVNLTHVNARKIEIVWDEDDLYDLLYRRFRSNTEFLEALNVSGASKDEVFKAVFPKQVDVGEKKPETWPWITARIRDGNNVTPPRNLIDLVTKAQAAQLRREDRDAREYSDGAIIIQGDALKRALTSLSQERVEDTLLAEAGEYAQVIERFRDGKSEHNEASLSTTLHADGEQLKKTIKILLQIGFLEKVGETYKIPMLYRDGLSITQGKAF